MSRFFPLHKILNSHRHQPDAPNPILRPAPCRKKMNSIATYQMQSMWEQVLPTTDMQTKFMFLVVLCIDAMRIELGQMFGSVAESSEENQINNSFNKIDKNKKKSQLTKKQKTKKSSDFVHESFFSFEQMAILRTNALLNFTKWRLEFLNTVAQALQVGPSDVRMLKSQAHRSSPSLLSSSTTNSGVKEWQMVQQQHQQQRQQNSVPFLSLCFNRNQPELKETPQQQLKNLQQQQQQKRRQLFDQQHPVLVPSSFPPSVSKFVRQLNESERLQLILLTLTSSLGDSEAYKAHTRVLMTRMVAALRLPPRSLIAIETIVAQSLKSGPLLADERENKIMREAAERDKQSRRWKIGLAIAVGGALVGISGGLAAPFMFSGLTAILGSLGLTSLSLLFTSVGLGNPMVVAALFGTLGGRVSGKIMVEYAKEVKDFKIFPVYYFHNPVKDASENETFVTQNHEAFSFLQQPPSSLNMQRSECVYCSTRSQSRPELGQSFSNSSQNQVLSSVGQTTSVSNGNFMSPHRLRLWLGVSGWVTSPASLLEPWKVVSPIGTEAFSLQYEYATMYRLGEKLETVAVRSAFSLAQASIVRIALPSILTAALMPIGLLRLGRFLKNPFRLAMNRSDKTGKVLAKALKARIQGERPITLVGYSLGARVVFSCLQQLASWNEFGLVENVALMGTPAPNDCASWRRIRAVVSGRVVNAYTAHDMVLGFLYRSHNLQMGVAGLSEIENVAGVKNVNVSDLVQGHTQYSDAVGAILLRGGMGEDLDMKAVVSKCKKLQFRQHQQRQMKKTGSSNGPAENNPEMVCIEDFIFGGHHSPTRIGHSVIDTKPSNGTGSSACLRENIGLVTNGNNNHHQDISSGSCNAGSIRNKNSVDSCKVKADSTPFKPKLMERMSKIKLKKSNLRGGPVQRVDTVVADSMRSTNETTVNLMSTQLISSTLAISKTSLPVTNSSTENKPALFSTTNETLPAQGAQKQAKSGLHKNDSEQKDEQGISVLTNVTRNDSGTGNKHNRTDPSRQQTKSDVMKNISHENPTSFGGGLPENDKQKTDASTTRYAGNAERKAFSNSHKLKSSTLTKRESAEYRLELSGFLSTPFLPSFSEIDRDFYPNNAAAAL